MVRNNRTISQRPNGTWANTKDGAERASSVHPTQAQAVKAAREQLKSSGGGELKIKDEQGHIRAKDTVPPAKDPHPPKG